MKVVVQDSKKSRNKEYRQFGGNCTESTCYLGGNRLVYRHVFICVSRKRPTKWVGGQLTDQPYLKITAIKKSHLNLSIEFLRDLLPLEFLRCSDESALWCPLVSREHHCLEHLDALEAALLPGRVALLEYKGLDFRFRTQICE